MWTRFIEIAGGVAVVMALPLLAWVLANVLGAFAGRRGGVST